MMGLCDIFNAITYQDKEECDGMESEGGKFSEKNMELIIGRTLEQEVCCPLIGKINRNLGLTVCNNLATIKNFKLIVADLESFSRS
jgi:hypothetical protein